MKASLGEQRYLLQLKDHDGTIGRLRYELAHLPIYATLADLEASLAQADSEAAGLAAKKTEIESVRQAAEAEAAKLTESIDVRQARYESGEGMDSRQLLTLESEISTLTATRDEAESRELEAMEQIEELDAQLAASAAHREQLEADQNAALAEKNSLEADYASKIAAEEARRAECAEQIGSSLLGAYQECRDMGGVGVVIMEEDGTVDGGLDLSMIEIGEINAQEGDEVYLTEDTGAIVVRAKDLAD